MTTVTLHRSQDSQLSDELIEKIRQQIKTKGETNPPSLYWNYRDKVSNETIEKALNTLDNVNVERPIDYISGEIWENSSETVYDVELEFIEKNLSDFTDEIRAELQMDEEEELDMKELARELRDEYLGDFYVNYDLKGLLNNTGDIPVRISMYSNYDCINSHWLETQGAYEMDSYFGDMVRMLQFNPADVKKMLLSKDLTCSGRWPNLTKKKPLVTLEHFWQELENSSCGANLLTFVGVVDAYEFLSNYNKKNKIIIPKGNNAGLFSSFQGGGSVIEMKLQRDFTIDLGKKYDASGYLKFALALDNENNHYSIQSVYGTGNSFFGAEIKIIK